MSEEQREALVAIEQVLSRWQSIPQSDEFRAVRQALAAVRWLLIPAEEQRIIYRRPKFNPGELYHMAEPPRAGEGGGE